MNNQSRFPILVITFGFFFLSNPREVFSFETNGSTKQIPVLNLPDLGNSGSGESKKKIKQIFKGWKSDLRMMGEAAVSEVNPALLLMGSNLVESYKDYTSYEYKVMGVQAKTMIRLERGRIETMIDENLNLTIKKLHKKPELTINYSLSF